MDGTVRNNQGDVVGQVAPNGQVWDANGHGKGQIVSTGSVHNQIMRGVGVVSTDTRIIWDDQGRPLGEIQPDGIVLDTGGTRIGSVSDAPIILTGGAALLLLFNPI